MTESLNRGPLVHSDDDDVQSTAKGKPLPQMANLDRKFPLTQRDDFPVYEGPFGDSKNCHIRQLSY